MFSKIFSFIHCKTTKYYNNKNISVRSLFKTKHNYVISYFMHLYYVPPCYFPAGIYLLKVNNRNTRTKCDICSKLTIKIPGRHHLRHSGIFIVNFEHIFLIQH